MWSFWKLKYDQLIMVEFNKQSIKFFYQQYVFRFEK